MTPEDLLRDLTSPERRRRRDELTAKLAELGKMRELGVPLSIRAAQLRVYEKEIAVDGCTSGVA